MVSGGQDGVGGGGFLTYNCAYIVLRRSLKNMYTPTPQFNSA